MSLSITLPNDLEQFLRNHALRVGVPMETLLTRTIVERWDTMRQAPEVWPTSESDLLVRLQNLFPSEQTREYQVLCKKSDAGELTETERLRFLSLLENRDHQNAERLQIAAQIAALRGVSLRETMKTLGIEPE